jgi:hypothetical protein
MERKLRVVVMKADTIGCMRINIEGDPNVSMECSVGDPTRPEELA